MKFHLKEAFHPFRFAGLRDGLDSPLSRKYEYPPNTSNLGVSCATTVSGNSNAARMGLPDLNALIGIHDERQILAVSFPCDNRTMRITWLGHGTFLFELSSGQTIVMDPWTDGNPAYPKGFEIRRVDTICITHGHFDHIHDAVPLAQKFSPEVVAIFETGNWLESKGVKNVRGMNKGGTQKVGDVSVTMTHAIHSCGIIDDGKIIYGGEAAGYVLRFGDGRSLYFSGDTNVFSDMALIQELYEPSLAFLPIGDHFTMGPREAAVACRLLKAKTVVPMHFGTFPVLTGRPGALQELVGGGTKVWALEAGKTVEW